jgi:hypothetical protein
MNIYIYIYTLKKHLRFGLKSLCLKAWEWSSCPFRTNDRLIEAALEHCGIHRIVENEPVIIGILSSKGGA